jgi:hypothetical protein
LAAVLSSGRALRIFVWGSGYGTTKGCDEQHLLASQTVRYLKLSESLGDLECAW